MLELAGIVLIVVLVLVGALMPLRYTARMHLPHKGETLTKGTDKAQDCARRPERREGGMSDPR